MVPVLSNDTGTKSVFGKNKANGGHLTKQLHATKHILYPIAIGPNDGWLGPYE